MIYVTDDKGVLLDDLRLAIAGAGRAGRTKVSELNDQQLVSIPATATRDEVVAAFEKYDRVALPVTDSRGVLVGIITVDDVLDVAEAGGHRGHPEARRHGGPRRAVPRRRLARR